MDWLSIGNISPISIPPKMPILTDTDTNTKPNFKRALNLQQNTIQSLPTSYMNHLRSTCKYLLRQLSVKLNKPGYMRYMYRTGTQT